MFFIHEKNDAANQNHERSFFYVCEKWYVQPKVTEGCEFRARTPAFYRRLQFDEMSTLALWVASRDIQRERTIKWALSRSKVKNISEIGIVSYISLTVKEENCIKPLKQLSSCGHFAVTEAEIKRTAAKSPAEIRYKVWQPEINLRCWGLFSNRGR